MKTIAYIILFFALINGTVFASNAPKKAGKKTIAGLYLTAKEAYAMKQADPNGTLIIDVRDPIEIMFTGAADSTDIYVPLLIADRTAFDNKNAAYQMQRNKNFTKEMLSELQKHNTSKSIKLIFMCRSGSTRSAPAADMLYVEGYKRVYTIVDGFEGGQAKEGPHKGARVVNGWKNSELPWSWKIPAAKAYLSLE